ncbi:MAG TPA: hypothetical protein VFQ60_00705 [Patescibacteria group bacterium]|nr:hypothetical protein [Patescibacteria group bacterium]
MDSKTWMAYFHAAPEPVQEYFLSDLSERNEAAAQKQLAYEHDAWERVMDVVWEVLFEQLSIEDFKEKLRRLAGDRKSEEVERAILLAVILPLADLVYWDVEARLQELGMTLADIQSVPRVTLRPVSFGAAVRRIASLAKISILQEEMARRLREALVSYVKGVRTIEQFKEILLRSQADGGLGFSREQTDVFMETCENFLSTTQVISEQEYADWLQQEMREAEAAKAARDSKPEIQTTEEEDLAALAARTPASAPSGPLDQAVEETYASLNLGNLDPYLAKRMRNIISTRLRDVRNAAQIKAILLRETKVGGMEFAPEEANRVAGIIEQMYEAHRSKLVEEEKRAIQETAMTQQAKIEERKKRESEEHAKWYAEKLQSRPEEILKRTIAARQASSADRAVMYAMAGANQKGVQVAVSGSSAAMASNPRVAVDSMRAPTRLIGLSEELAGMTMAAFRRLSADPEQAANKIRQKLETLKADSFEKWVEGVEAWRQSPLQEQYLKLVAESFKNGIPVGELVEKKRKEQPELPNSAEIGAIIALNGELQY